MLQLGNEDRKFFENEIGVLYQGDCLQVLQILPDASVDALITDPPYSSGGAHISSRQRSPKVKYFTGESAHHIDGDNMDQHSYYRWAVSWLSEARRLMVPGAPAVVFSDWRQLPLLTDAFQAAGFIWRGVVPWDKRNSRPIKGGFRAQCEYMVWGSNGSPLIGSSYNPGMFTVSIIGAPKRRHCMEKPLKLLNKVIDIVPTAGTVLDPFAGSGTTLEACQSTGRGFIGIELDPTFCQVIKDRLTINK